MTGHDGPVMKAGRRAARAWPAAARQTRRGVRGGWLLAYAVVGLTSIVLMLFVRRVEVANVATGLSLAFA